MTQAIPLEVPPGIVTRGTIAQRIGRWVDGELVRFDGGSVVPMKGWQLVSGNTTYLRSKSTIRNILAWRDSANKRWHVLAGADALLVQAGGYSHETLVDVLPADYTAGRESGSVSKGYGAGPYGRGAYGSDYESGSDGATIEILNATVWHLGVRLGKLYGVSTSDQRILEWTPPDTTVKAAPVENAPVGVLCMCVTQNMQLLTVGDGGNQNRIRWSDSSDITVWTPVLDGTNNAGSLEYPLIGQPLKLMPFGQDVLLFTTSALYRLSYHGAEFGYGVVLVAEGVAPIGPNAITLHTDVAMWMGRGEFYTLAGGGVTSMPCDVHDFAFEQLNRIQGWKVNAAVLPTQNEAYWWFCSNNASEPDRYVAFDYEQGAWLKGTRLNRTAWINPGVYEDPLACSTENVLYLHEKGSSAAGENMRSRALLAVPPMGAQEMVVDQLNQDIVGDGSGYPDVVLRMWVANAPGEQFKQRFTGRMDKDGQSKCRVTGRWLLIDYEITAWSGWRLGRSTLYAKPGGLRGRRLMGGMRGDPSSPITAGSPQVTTGPTISNITASTATISLTVDRSCSWSTTAQGKVYSGTVRYVPVGAPVAPEFRRVLIEINLTELLPDTDYNLVITLANLAGGGTNEVEVPLFRTAEDTGEPLVFQMHWENITASSADLYYTTNVTGNWRVIVDRYTTGDPPQEFYPGVSTDTGESIIQVGSTNATNNTPLDPGCTWVQTANDLTLESQVGGPAEAFKTAPDLTTLGTGPALGVNGLQWLPGAGDQWVLAGNIEGYLYETEIRVFLQEAQGAVYEESITQPDGTEAFLVVFDLPPVEPANPAVYNGTITLTNISGTIQESVPELGP